MSDVSIADEEKIRFEIMLLIRSHGGSMPPPEFWDHFASRVPFDLVNQQLRELTDRKELEITARAISIRKPTLY